MHFKKLNIEGINREINNFKMDKSDSYLESYPFFTNYFSELSPIEESNLAISSHFIYGWMPTIIHLNKEDLVKVLYLLNSVKSGHIIDAKDSLILKKCINNSLVGLSKLLHFINPEQYAIWDSRIYRYLTGKKSQYSLSSPEKFLIYQNEMRILAHDNSFKDFKIRVFEKLGYHISSMRVIEMVMFEADKRVNSL